jgi:hypothetical protein
VICRGTGATSELAHFRENGALPAGLNPRGSQTRKVLPLTRARGYVLVSVPGARHISEPMAGSPLKRARKQGIRLADGSVIAFPYMPRVADLPPGWRHFSAAQKIEHLIGLDRCHEILSWPWAGLDPVRRSMQMQVMRVLLPIGIKAVLDGSFDRELARERNRAAVLEALARDLGAGEEKAQDSVQG